MWATSPKKFIEYKNKAELYAGLKYELYTMEQWTGLVSDITAYQHDHINTWINYYEETSDTPPVNTLMYRTYLPRETKYLDRNRPL